MSKKLIDKIKALLARADKDRNDNEHEREIAMRQATKLMDQHSISKVDLDLEDEEDDERGRSAYESSTPWKASVLNVIARLYGCKGYRSPQQKRSYIVGRESHRTIALSMTEYVIKSIEREAKNYAGTGRAYIISFKKGAANGVADQVRELERARKAGETTSSSTALAVVNHYELEKQANLDWLKSIGVKLSAGRRTSASDRFAFNRGREYGARISLNNQIGSSGSKQRLLK